MNVLNIMDFSRLTPEKQLAMRDWLDSEDLLNRRVIAIEVLDAGKVRLTMNETGDDGQVKLRPDDEFPGEMCVYHVYDEIEPATPPPFVTW
jgi:hypothetical protein